MNFQRSCEVVGLQAHLKDVAGLEFRYHSSMRATVRINKDYPDDQKASDASSVLCVGITSRELNDSECVAEIHDSISNSVDGRWANFGGVKQERMPFIYSQIDPVFKALGDLMEATITVLRWRSGLTEGLTNPFLNRREFLSTDGESWFEVHTVRGLKIVMLHPPRQIPLSLESEVAQLVSATREEPLGHQLFREAWNEKKLHPRSALVIGVAAAEVGLKNLIGTLVPQARWLVDEVQTPSIDNMLRKYLPTLPIKAKFHGKTINLPSELCKVLASAFQWRNKVVHAGKTPPSEEELELMLRAIEDFLWICDVYSGSQWAGQFISSETLAAWKNE